MLFNSLDFLLFFIIVTVSFFLLPHRFRWFLLLAASCYFYMVFVPIYILILGATIVIDYFAGLLIEKSEGKRRHLFLIISLVANIGVLAVFKYYNFFIENINLVAGSGFLPYLQILLPIGLSFHTFQAMSYTIEVFRKNQVAEKHFGIYALYVMFYPQLVAGPIERPQNILHQFHEEKKADYSDLVIGLSQMIRGFFKKVVVADLLSGYVDSIYNSYQINTGFTLIFASWLFLIQIYCDFSGYTDIAIGAARMMGFKLMTNFNLPLFSKTLSELWKRWHISLSTWFRDYLFNPILIKRRDWGKWALVYATMITFLISGIWHGASWNFVIWGLLQGFFLSLEIILGIKTANFKKSRLKRMAGIFMTFNIYAFTLIFFRSYTFEQAITIVKNIFTPTYFFNLKITDSSTFVNMFIPLILLFLIEYFIFRNKTYNELLIERPKFLFAMNAAFIIFILLFGVSNGEQFIYFQF